MYNYKITRISYGEPCLIGFCSILCLGEILGLFIALWDRDWIGIVGGAFFGVAFGLLGSALILIFIFVFNLFLPITNGVSVQIIPDTPTNASIAAATLSDADKDAAPNPPSGEATH